MMLPVPKSIADSSQYCYHWTFAAAGNDGLLPQLEQELRGSRGKHQEPDQAQPSE